MAEDWRITATLEEHGRLERLLDALAEHTVEREVRERLGGRVAVSGGDDTLFLYADTRAAAVEAERVLREILERNELPARLRLDRWHAIEEAWEDAEVPLPATDAERRTEAERLAAEETRESQETGLAAWEVRVGLASQADAVKLQGRLEAEGRRVVRRSAFLLVGANNQEEADELAETLRRDAPPGAAVHAEPGGGSSWQLYDRRPFAIFGGLAG